MTIAVCPTGSIGTARRGKYDLKLAFKHFPFQLHRIFTIVVLTKKFVNYQIITAIFNFSRAEFFDSNKHFLSDSQKADKMI